MPTSTVLAPAAAAAAVSSSASAPDIAAHPAPVVPTIRAAVAALPAYVAGRRAQSELTAALASNESHYPPLPSVLDVVQRSALDLNRYPDMAALELRTAIATHLSVDVDEVAVGPGSVGVLQQIISAVCDHGDDVVFAWRSFEAYPILVSLAGARAVSVALRADEGHDLDAMLAAITDRTTLIILCSPNNPTGTTISGPELTAFLAQVPPHVLVVLDEAYTEYVTTDDAVDALQVFRAYPNVCVLRTFSKAHGLAGLRVGYAVATRELAEALRRTALPFAVSGLAQRAAIASLAATAEMQVRVAAVTRERTRMIAAVRELGWTVPDSQANFLWLRTDDGLRTALIEMLADNDILVRGYAGDGVRITLADEAANNRVLAALGRYTPKDPS